MTHRKRILVLGGSSGIGGAIAESLIAEGHCVGIVSRRAARCWTWRVPPGWDEDANLVRADLRQPTQVAGACARWAGETLSGLILSAVDYGGSRRQRIGDVELSSWQSVFETNVVGFAAVISAALPALLRSRSGLVVNIASETAYHPAPGRAPYGASKAAQRHILSSLLEEVGPGSLSIVELLPEGMVRTPGIERRRPSDTDWAPYASPTSFCRIVNELFREAPPRAGYRALAIGRGGDARESNGCDVTSQSERPVCQESV